MTDNHNNMQENDETFADDKLTDEEYIRKQFADLPCPPLPESLRAENIWKKFCAEEGDGIVTIPPQIMSEEPLQEETPVKGVAQNVVDVDFEVNQKAKSSNKGKVISLARRRNTIAIACSLVLVVGLSAIFWKLNPAMQKTDSMLDNQALQARDVSREEAEEEEVEEVEESVEEILDESAPEKAVMEESESAPKQDETTPLQAAAETETLKKQSPEPSKESEEQDEREKLRQRILDSMEVSRMQETKQQPQKPLQLPQNSATNPEEAVGYALPNEGESVDNSDEQEEAEEESIDEEAEEELPSQNEQTDPQAKSDKTESDKKTLQEVPVEESSENKQSIIRTLKNQQESLPKTYQIKNGSLTHDPAANQVILKDQNGTEQYRMTLEPQTKVLAADSTFCTVNENTESSTVTMVLYRADDLSSPKEVNRIVHQGVLFDFYQYSPNSYALVTSVCFNREQVESGDYLPTVNGQIVSTDKVNIIEGYGEADRVHFLLTTILKNNSAKTRADLHLK